MPISQDVVIFFFVHSSFVSIKISRQKCLFIQNKSLKLIKLFGVVWNDDDKFFAWFSLFFFSFLNRMYVVRLRPKKCISLFVANADFNWMENLCACDCTVCVLRYSTERVGECHKNTTTTERKNWMGEIEGTNTKKK